MDFKSSCFGGGAGGGVGGGGSGNSLGGVSTTAGSINIGLAQHSNGGGSTGSNLCLSSPSPDGQQFNIFPAIFSRQLNFTGSPGGSSGGNVGSGAGSGLSGSSSSACSQSKLMDDLRPNLVGGLLGLQQGLLDEHALSHSNHHQHCGQESKFMSMQDNRLMGMSAHDNRLLGLSSHDVRSVVGGGGGGGGGVGSGGVGSGGVGNVGGTGMDNNKNGLIGSGGHHHQRKCSSTPEDFSALYGGLSTSGLGDTSSHHHTPAHTPPSSRLVDHSISGKPVNHTRSFHPYTHKYFV